MPKYHHDIIQGSDEWFKIKLDKPLSASHAQAIATGGKGLETLVWEKLAEKYSTGQKEEYTNEHLERGKELESQARSIYELETGNTVTEVGFVTSDISDVVGVSPDGLVGEDGLLEIKCFEDKKHFRMVVEGHEVESQYDWQVQMQLLITGRKWCDFVAYNPNFEKSLLVTRIFPDEKKHEKILAGIKKGEILIKEITEKICISTK